MTINEKVARAKLLCEMIHNFISSNVDELETLQKDIKVAVESNDKAVTSEEWASLRDVSLSLYDGREWARLGVCLWDFSRRTANLIIMRATNSPSLGLKLSKTDAQTIMKETRKSVTRSPEVPNLSELSAEDKRAIVEYLRTGVKK